MISFKTTHNAKHSKKLAKAGLEFVDEVNQYTDASTFDVIAGVGVGAIVVDINKKTSKETVVIEVYSIGFATKNAKAAINHLENELETLEKYEEIGELTSYLKSEKGGFRKERDELTGIHMVDTGFSVQNAVKLSKAALEFSDHVDKYGEGDNTDIVAVVDNENFFINIERKNNSSIIEIVPQEFVKEKVKSAIEDSVSQLKRLDKQNNIEEVEKELRSEVGGYVSESYTTEEGDSKEGVSVPIRMNQLENEIKDIKQGSLRRRLYDILGVLAFIMSVITWILLANL